MSRSYRKNPYYGPKDQDYKNISNRKIRAMHRRGEYLPDGRAYRKVVCSYDICDQGGLGPTWKEQVAKAEYRNQRHILRPNWWYNMNPPSLTTEQDELDWKAIYRKWWTDYKAK